MRGEEEQREAERVGRPKGRYRPAQQRNDHGERKGEGQIADIEAPSTECNADVALDWPVVSI